MKITFDFDNNTFTDEHGTQSIPDLNEKKDAILKAAGLEIISGEELRNDIDALFQSLGLNNLRCARPGEE